MCNLLNRNVLIAAVFCLIVMIILGGCTSTREYYDDIHIPLEAYQEEIIIKEWTYLLGSGAEIYYKAGGNEILLGNLLGGDDGFCPFKEGLYTVAIDHNELTIEWCRFPSSDKESWEKKTIQLPDKVQ